MDMSLVNSFDRDNILVARVDDFLNWARASSTWYFQFGLACCAMPRASPRQADVIIVSGTVTMTMATRIKRLYDQMAEPKYIISMGSCSNSGGPYWQHGYHVLKGVDLIVPVDIYVPGCPPRPEALIDGLLALHKKIREDTPLRKVS